MRSTPAFAREFARAAVSAGAGVVLIQGAHAPLRGIEVHDGVPVLYEPGPLFRLGRREAQPHDFYTRWGNAPHVRSYDAGLLEAFGERDAGKQVLSPAEGNAHHPGAFVPVCEVDRATHLVTGVALHPIAWSTARRATAGFPVRLTGDRAEAVLARVAELSAPYGTRVTARGGTGWVEV
jgi:poly-gamma-glutamate synthesis protein (capsule biosynthesis protein)